MTEPAGPLLLGIDTSGRWAGVALSRGDDAIAELTWQTGLQHTSELFPNVERLFAVAGYDRADLSGIVVCTGPGSFNGLRSGVSAAKGLAFALGIPAVGVSTFEARALQVAAPGLVICTVFSSGRADLVAAVYRWSNDELVALIDPEVAPIQAWLDRLPPRAVVIGELWPDVRERLREGNLHIVPESLAAPRPTQAIRLAWPRWQASDFDDPRSLQPNYMRPPQITQAGRGKPASAESAAGLPRPRLAVPARWQESKEESVLDLIFSEEQKQLQRDVRALVDQRLEPIAHEVDEMEDVSLDVVRILAEANLFRWLTTREFGGPAETVKAVPLCIIREELTRGCAQADTTFAMQGLGSYPILVAGNDAQKQKYIPPVISGDKLASLALTDPDSGSDVAGMKLTATRDGDDYLLNGQKKFTSNAPAAETYVVYGKTNPEAGAKGISAFIVEKGWPGFDLSHRLHLIAAHSVCQPKFVNCRVPRENLLGEENAGFKIAMQTLDLFRTTVGACAMGAARAALDAAIAFSKQRRAFGQTLGDFQATKFKLADMATELEAGRLLVYNAATKKDAGAPRVTLEASMAKLYCTEAAGRIVDQAVQIHGGQGVEKGSLVERLYREVRSTRIYEGTSEIQRLVIGDLVLKM